MQAIPSRAGQGTKHKDAAEQQEQEPEDATAEGRAYPSVPSLEQYQVWLS